MPFVEIVVLLLSVKDLLPLLLLCYVLCELKYVVPATLQAMQQFSHFYSIQITESMSS